MKQLDYVALLAAVVVLLATTTPTRAMTAARGGASGAAAVAQPALSPLYAAEFASIVARHPSRHSGQPLPCGECQALFEGFFLLLQDEPLLNATVGAALRGECRKVFNTTSDRPLVPPCDGLVDGLIHLVSHLGEALVHWHVNFKEVACADFLASCVNPCCSSEYTPEQVRLSFADGNPVREGTAMTAAWVTLNTTSTSVVRWRKVGATNDTWEEAEGTWRTYTRGGWIGVVHGATMIDLDAGAGYEYMVGCPTHGFSEVFAFNTLPLNIGTGARPLHVAGLADMGWANHSTDTITRLEELAHTGAIDFVIHPGDIGYADGDEHWWDIFGRKMQNLTARVPYMTVQGNHEQIWWNATGYKTRWWMPTAGDGAPSDATYYSLSVGPAMFLMLDTETVWNTPHLGPVQLRWAATQMERANAAGQFIMVAHHRPFYCSSFSISDCTVHAEVLRGEAEALYNEHGVGAVMCGHVHNYERTYAVDNNQTVSKSNRFPTAPIYLVNGAAGNREGQAHFYTTDNQWSALRTMDRGFMQYTFVQDSTVAPNVTFMYGQFWRSVDNQVVDDFQVEKITRGRP